MDKAIKSNIVLIGMPGAGKSSVGIVLAKRLGYGYIDGDLLIQSQCDKTLQRLLDACGPEEFIEVEGSVLKGIEANESVIAPGGSAVYSDEAMRHLTEIGRIVYLELSLDELKRRLGSFENRGVVLKNGIGMSLEELYAERKPLYEKYAEITVNVDGTSIHEAVLKVEEALA
ncbi:MAG: shikimate kinase [Eggerthellaceae bacterium]|nr:shikimate kinase [Eggerthellaceae bacterium]